MYILGVSCYFHDAAAALLQDGVLIAAAEEERFSRRKHDSDFPRCAVDFCLREAGIRLTDVDHVAYSFGPALLLGRWNKQATITLPLEPSAHPVPEEWSAAWESSILATSSSSATSICGTTSGSEEFDIVLVPGDRDPLAFPAA